MLNLAKSGASKESDTALGVSQSTKTFLVNGREALVACAGTISTNTISVMCSPDGGATWLKYRPDGADGQPATKTITSTQLSAADVIYPFYVFGMGQMFRFDADANGTGVDVDFWVSGDVHVNDD